MICHTAADPEAYPELPSEVDFNLPFLKIQLEQYVFPGGQLHGTLSIGTPGLISSSQIVNLLLCDHCLQGGQHQDWAAHVPQENPRLQAGQHQVHGFGECYNNLGMWVRSHEMMFDTPMVQFSPVKAHIHYLFDCLLVMT